MLKIYALDYYRLENAEHNALMDFFEGAIVMYPIVYETFPRAVEMFRSALKEEHHAMRYVFRTTQSAAIRKADAERIKDFRILRDYAKVKMLGNDEAIVEAAKSIVMVSDVFGGSRINCQPVDSRTGNLTVFIQRLEKDYHNDVVTLNLQHNLQLLKQSNLNFLKAQSVRNHTDAEFGKNAKKRARKNCDFALKTLFSLIQDKIRLGEGEEFEPFVKYINIEIDYKRISLGQGPGDRKPKRRKTEEEETDEMEIDIDMLTPPMHGNPEN